MAPPTSDATGRSPKQQSLGEQAYQQIKRDILSGELPPGLPLRLGVLTQKYGFSYTPLREAMSRLRSENLVDAMDLKGFSVAPLLLDEMHDAIQMRIFMECEALKRSIEHGNEDWAAKISASLHALETASQLHDDSDARSIGWQDEVEKHHLALHRALIAACNSRWLLDFSMQLYVQTERYRRPALLNAAGPNPERDVSREHSDIVTATLDRDITAACALLAGHYQKTARFIEQWSRTQEVA